MKFWKKSLCALLAVLLVASALPAALAAETHYATRGEVADALLAAADDYNPGVQRSDILRGYANGELDEDGYVTRAQALVMLTRAFGDLPDPIGDNLRSGYAASNFTDVPAWAKAELADVFDAGIVAGTTASTFSPNARVTARQLELFIGRVYALEGSNLKDDFYAAVNKTALDASVIQPGYMAAGSFNDLAIKVNSDVAALIREAAAAPKSEAERKIAALYNNILAVDERNAAGIAPVRTYVEQITKASTLRELLSACDTVYRELGLNLLAGFSLTVDSKDSTSYMLTFGSLTPSLGQSGYDTATSDQREAYLVYLQTLSQLLGRAEMDARHDADNIWELESAVAAQSLTNQELGDVDKTYNVYTMAQLQSLFPNLDLDALFDRTGLARTDRIVVTDVGALTAAASFFDEAHLETLRSACLLGIAGGYGACLGEGFLDAQSAFQTAYYGVSGSLAPEDLAAQYVQALLGDYLGEAYVSRHFSARAKADVEQMVRDILSVYKQRINALTWMSASTKAKAVRKLDTMALQIGYPDQWDDALSAASILPSSQGGSFFDNVVAIQKAYNARLPKLQSAGVDKNGWVMQPYTVNACYDPSKNTIEFPAGILQSPFYDVNASYEQNLGSIGYVIAHEITHAFDNNGAKYDENGNAADWWTAEDYAAFQTLCRQVTALYDGVESAPGVTCSGALTLSENIADLGAMACITELEGRRASPDYRALYTAAGQIWCSSYTREMKLYLARTDVHAPDKLRGSLVLRQFQSFYDAFGITEGDGMWLAPEDRVVIW